MKVVLPSDNTIYGLFEKTVQQNKDNIAIIEKGRSLTFGELSDLVSAIASFLPKDVKTVGIVMSHRAEMIAAMLAALKVGARYVPAEPTFPVERIRFMMQESGAEVVLTESSYKSMFEDIPIQILDCELCANLSQSEQAQHEISPEDPAYVLYTSGTTGRPKGICVTNANVCHYVRAFANEFSPRVHDVMLQYSVCTFDIFVEEVFASLLAGAAIAIPPASVRDNITKLMQFVEEHGVTIVSGFPRLLAEMNALPTVPKSLRLLISGGDVLRGRYVDKLIGQVDVYNTYGPSETTVCATYFRCNDAAPLADGTYPIGKAVKGVQVRILNPEGEEVQAGAPGELCILGDGVSQGYIGGRTEENRAFEHLPDGTTMYRSGDVGYRLPDGNIAFLHRLDSQVMVDGKRVELTEVEHALNACTGVSQALVRAHTDSDDAVFLTAYVVGDGNEVSERVLRKELAKSLADFMIPSYFVRIPAIPLNANGKPDYTKLPIVMRSAREH